MITTLRFHCGVRGFNPWSGNEDPQVMRQTNKNNKAIFFFFFFKVKQGKWVGGGGGRAASHGLVGKAFVMAFEQTPDRNKKASQWTPGVRRRQVQRPWGWNVLGV